MNLSAFMTKIELSPASEQAGYMSGYRNVCFVHPFNIFCHSKIKNRETCM